jgi:hypothetical protein
MDDHPFQWAIEEYHYLILGSWSSRSQNHSRTLHVTRDQGSRMISMKLVFRGER